MQDDQLVGLDPGTKSILTMFGYGTTLLSVDDLSPEPTLGGWKSLTLQTSRTPEYRAKLCRSHIAVVCGAPSENLCAIAVPDLQRVNNFVSTNPALSKALVTAGPGWFYIWCRVDDFCPPNAHESGFRWISAGAVVVYQRMVGNLYHVVRDGQPVTIRVDHLTWPGEIGPTFVFGRVHQHYPPLVQGKKGQLFMNPAFVAAFMSDALKLHYDPETRSFYNLLRGGPKLECDERVMNGAAGLIRCLSAKSPQPVVVDTSLKKLREVTQYLKLQALRPLPGVEGGVARFLESAVVHSKGHSITSGEILSAYRRFESQGGLLRLTDRQVLARVTKLIRKKFGVAKVHCIERNGKHLRGFLHLKLCGQDASDASDAGEKKETAPAPKPGL